MIWVTWRQHRQQLFVGAATLAVLVGFLLLTGFGIASTFRTSGLARCLAIPGRDCGDLSQAFGDRYSSLSFLIPLFLIVPAVIGMFWGAPLVAREIEQGTHRLAWTQSVTRLRWLGTKAAALAMATVSGAVVVAWVLSWWSRPLVAASDNRLRPGIFDLRGVVPVAYALFALAVGAAAGVLIRRTVPAMAATFAAFGGVRLAVALWLRPHFASPKSISFELFAKSPRTGHGDWVLSTKTLDAAGRFLGNGQTLNLNLLASRCPSLGTRGAGLPNPVAVKACINRIGLHVQQVYQPGNRYWTFQGIESAIFVTLAVGLLALSAWWVRRRIV